MQIAKKSHFVIKSGDVIYNKLFAWKGSFGIAPPELDGMFVSDKFPTYELDRQKVYENWLRWYFRCPALWEEARTMSTGSAALSKLTLNPPKLLLLTMPLPPLDEQRRIVVRIEAVAARVEEARGLRRQAQKERRALISGCLGRMALGIRVDGHLGNVLQEKPRNGWSVRCDGSENGIPVLSLGAVTGFQYRATEFKRTSESTSQDADYWLQPGDLLVTRSNTPELVGHAAIYNGSPYPCIYPDLMMRLVVDENRADKHFVHRWLMIPSVRDYVLNESKGTSPTMKKISQGVVMNIPFPSSLSLPEQRRIVAYLNNLEAKVETLKRLQAETAAELDALLPSILDRAFKGEL
ncbi:MAG: hypothetical protein AUI36_46980 [Cyanobacteria bacterium 13_1_40CM_2_61_4]|nr:MAG: hypothetical protein AUI36_46980 [Cyanobacteria bacterium 13_1_40CM_2_61_4]